MNTPNKKLLKNIDKVKPKQTKNLIKSKIKYKLIYEIKKSRSPRNSITIELNRPKII